MKQPVNCLNPQRIRNKYTGEYLYVGCGKCKACIKSKTMKNTLKCRLESLSHKYCFFVTLTYDEQNIPRFTLIHAGDKENLNTWYSVNICQRLDKYIPEGEIFGSIEMDIPSLKMLQEKVENYNFPYLAKIDVQLFIKRLRKHLNRYSNEKIRYYCIGEFGPIHFRPHYHLLLWFDRIETFEKIGVCIDRSWKLGRVDYSAAQDKAISYVTGYVNNTCELPRIFTFDEISPFSIHSFHLGEKVLKTKKEDVYEKDYKQFVRRSMCFNGSSSEFTVWRSFESRFFPKCYGYSALSQFERHASYRAYEFAREWTAENSPSKIAKALVYDLLNDFHDTRIHDLLHKLFTANDFNPFCKEHQDRLYRQIYLFMSVSKHFLEFVCDRPTEFEINRKINIINEYYTKKDFECLTNQLKLQDDIIKSHSPECLSMLFVESTPEAIKHNPDIAPFLLASTDTIVNSRCYREYKSKVYKDYEDSIKHKELNDLNRIYINL